MSDNLYMKPKEFLRKLRRLGVRVVAGKGKGSHVRLEFQGRRSTLPMHGSKDLDPVFIKAICIQLGIDPEEFG